MLMPSIFGENLFDDFFGDFPFYYDDRAMKDAEKKLYGRKASHVMKTDIKETDKGYELVVDLPGFTKDEIHAALENGYLTISAEKGLDKDEKEKETGRYIRRERIVTVMVLAYKGSVYVNIGMHVRSVKIENKLSAAERVGQSEPFAVPSRAAEFVSALTLSAGGRKILINTEIVRKRDLIPFGCSRLKCFQMGTVGVTQMEIPVIVKTDVDSRIISRLL